jgi:hypothetical protein
MFSERYEVKEDGWSLNDEMHRNLYCYKYFSRWQKYIRILCEGSGTYEVKEMCI